MLLIGQSCESEGRPGGDEKHSMETGAWLVTLVPPLRVLSHFTVRHLIKAIRQAVWDILYMCVHEEERDV